MASPSDEVVGDKPSIAYIETDDGHKIQRHETTEDNAAGKKFSVDDADLPKGYFSSIYFWGSLIAIGMSLMAGVAGYAFIAAILTFIDNDIGPDANITWVALTYTLTGSVGLMIVGRLTDIFGRRWFFILGNVLALIGSIVCATAPNVPALIAGETLIGLASSAQLSFVFTVAELVPMKYRVMANSYCYLWIILPNAFGPIIGYAFVFQSSVGWRGTFYVLIGINTAATALFYFFYYPPSFEMKHGHGRKMQYIKEFDYIGALMATLGLLLFLMGLSWGGNLYPWNSAHVIATLVVGAVLLIGFFFYEAYVPLKEPLLPMELCTNRNWLILTIIWAIGASVYYAFALIWPQMVNSLYADQHDQLWAGWAAGVVGGGITAGEVLAAVVKKKAHWAIRIIFPLGAILLAAMATCTPDSPNRAILLLLFGATFIGANETLTSTCSGICIDDQRELGTALGLGASVRQCVSTIASTVYTVVLTNRLASTVPQQVPGALTQAGLPASSVEAFLTAYASGSQAALNAVPGITANILAVGTAAYKAATADAYSTVFLTTIAFSGIGIVLTWFIPDIDSKLTGTVTATVGNRKAQEDSGELTSEKVV